MVSSWVAQTLGYLVCDCFSVSSSNSISVFDVERLSSSTSALDMAEKHAREDKIERLHEHYAAATAYVQLGAHEQRLLSRSKDLTPRRRNRDPDWKSTGTMAGHEGEKLLNSPGSRQDWLTRMLLTPRRRTEGASVARRDSGCRKGPVKDAFDRGYIGTRGIYYNGDVYLVTSTSSGLTDSEDRAAFHFKPH